MRRITVLLIMMVVLTAALSAQAWDRTGYQMRDKSQEVVGGMAPDGALTQLLTVASTTIDLTGTLWYALYAPSAVCKVRLMPAADSVKANYTQFSVPAASWMVRGVNKDTPFANISGCTSGEKQGQ